MNGDESKRLEVLKLERDWLRYDRDQWREIAIEAIAELEGLRANLGPLTDRLMRRWPGHRVTT